MRELSTAVDRDADLAIEFALIRDHSDIDGIDVVDLLDRELDLDDSTQPSLVSPSYADVRAEHGTSAVADAARLVARQTALLWAHVAEPVQIAEEHPEVQVEQWAVFEAYSGIDAHARQLAAQPDEDRTRDQLRADVAADLLTGTAPRRHRPGARRSRIVVHGRRHASRHLRDPEPEPGPVPTLRFVEAPDPSTGSVLHLPGLHPRCSMVRHRPHHRATARRAVGPGQPAPALPTSSPTEIADEVAAGARRQHRHHPVDLAHRSRHRHRPATVLGADPPDAASVPE